MGDIPHDWKWKLGHWWYHYEGQVLKAFIVVGILVIMLLAGCGFAQPFVTPPGDTACVHVRWTDQAEIQAYCPPGATACATVGPRYQMQQIWTVKPLAFDDYDAVMRLGHEFLHSLGARHR